MRDYGPWKIKGTRCRFENAFFRVLEDEVIQPDGQPGTYATVNIKPGVSVLPLDQHGNVYLVRQFRYALGHDSIEVISGGLNEGELPLDGAKREAREELGITARYWVDLGQIEEDTSLVRSRGYLFLGQGLEFGEIEPDGTEKIERLKLPLVEAVEKVMRSEIVHSPSALLIMKAAQYLARQE